MTRKKLSLEEQINRKKWWHSPAWNRDGYENRGIFFTWCFKEAEFYGRPLDTPFKVNVQNALVGTEESIILTMFGKDSSEYKLFNGLKNNVPEYNLKRRYELDNKMMVAAQDIGFDAIVTVSESDYEKMGSEIKVPRIAELNILSSNFEKSCTPVKP